MSRYALFDSHCDTPYELWRKKEMLTQNSCHIDLAEMNGFDGYAQFFAFCTYAGLKMGYTCEQLLWEPYHYFMNVLQTSSVGISLCTDTMGMEKAFQENKVAAFLSLEGAEGIGCDPGKLELLRASGFTMVNLTWNENNSLAGASAKSGYGLTKQGKEFVRRAQDLGLMIDVSHLSDRAFWDIMDLATKPVVASHSNSRALCDHHRNLTDDQYLAICESGGYVGLNLYVPFLSGANVAHMDDVYAHMDHFLALCDGHVVLGGDLDGCDQLPAGFSGGKSYEMLSSYLENKGYSSGTIQNIYCNTIKEVVNLCTM